MSMIYIFNCIFCLLQNDEGIHTGTTGLLLRNSFLELTARFCVGACYGWTRYTGTVVFISQIFPLYV